jgi:8-oxo-dGTP diphosphatase
MAEKTQVGTAALITRDNKVLLVKRKGSHGAGTWSPPGGHFDFGESIEQCTARETKEEVGLDITDIRFRAITNDVFEDEGKHYVTIWMDAKPASGEPFVAAEKEVAEIGWFNWDALPQPLFLPLENLVRKNSYPPK